MENTLSGLLEMVYTIEYMASPPKQESSTAGLQIHHKSEYIGLISKLSQLY